MSKYFGERKFSWKGTLGIFETQMLDEYEQQCNEMTLIDMLAEANLLEATFTKINKSEFDNRMLQIFYMILGRKLR